MSPNGNLMLLVNEGKITLSLVCNIYLSEKLDAQFIVDSQSVGIVHWVDA